MARETQAFFKLFWNKDLDEGQARALLTPTGAAKP
jgi:hypothetical protein